MQLLQQIVSESLLSAAMVVVATLSLIFGGCGCVVGSGSCTFDVNADARAISKTTTTQPSLSAK